MALIRKFEHQSTERAPSRHKEVKCTYNIFEVEGGEKYIQLNTFGSKTREIPGKQSQTIQLDADGVRALRKILDREFK